MSEGQAKTLTDRQQKRALSSQKASKGLNRSVRNVLAKPYSCFWPLVDADTESEVLSLLQLLLPAARKLVTAEDRRLFRKMQGKKRKEARSALSEKIWERNPQAKDLRRCLVIGVNDVSRGLEDSTLASILISNDADPPILTKHLATLAATRNVPHIVLQNLKSCTKESLEISSLAMGLKKVVAQETSNHFHPIHLKVEGIFKAIAKSILSDSPLDDAQILTQTVEEAPPAGLKPKFSSPSDVYLIRSSKNHRVFQPGKVTQAQGDSSWSPYISLSSEDKGKPNISQPKESNEILGSKSVPGAFPFLPKVKDAKKGFIQSSQEKKTGAFISMSDGKEGEDDKMEVEQMKKSVKRYFSSLAPLKVKRIQGNPMKVKKNQKGKQKE